MSRRLIACGLLTLVGLVAATLVSAQPAKRMRPVVLMHGLLADKEAMSHIAGWIAQDFPGIYIHNADIPTQNTTNGHWDSLFIPMDTQVQEFARQLQADPNLADGFDLIGHSQGGLITRAFIERFNNPKVHNYISLAGPHGGVYGVPDFNAWCPDFECPWLAEFFSSLAEGGALAPVFQSHISIAQYWKDPMHYAEYLNVSAFLADINNERNAKSATYRNNFVNISGNATLVMALKDQIVVPRESAWFQFFTIGQDKVIQNFTDTDTYRGDWIGLRTMDITGRLERLAVDCGHQELPQQACKPQVYDAIIKPRVGGWLP